MPTRRARVLAIIGALAIESLSAVARSPQGLPTVAVDQFPAAARAAVSRAYKDAVAQPDNPAAVGVLGRVLHAWEQWESAHQAYRRAQALAPKTFDWPYLDAVVLQRLARHAD